MAVHCQRKTHDACLKGDSVTCNHLKSLYDYCQSHNLRLSSTDLVRIICPQCGVEEECPSVLMDEYESRHPDAKTESDIAGGEPSNLG